MLRLAAFSVLNRRFAAPFFFAPLGYPPARVVSYNKKCGAVLLRRRFVCKCSVVTEYSSPFPRSRSWPIFLRQCLKLFPLCLRPALNVLSLPASTPLASHEITVGFYIGIPISYRFYTDSARRPPC